MRIHQIIYTLKGFMEEKTLFSNTLQILVQNTNWSPEMFAAYFNVDNDVVYQWLCGSNIPDRARQVAYIESIAAFMDIDITRIAETLRKLELHQSTPSNNNFVDAMQAIDFSFFSKELIGKGMFGPHATARQAGSKISNYKKRRSMPTITLQKDMTEGAARAIEVQFLSPFERVTKVDDVEKLPKPEILPSSSAA